MLSLVRPHLPHSPHSKSDYANMTTTSDPASWSQSQSVKTKGDDVEAVEYLLDPIFAALSLPPERRVAIITIFHNNDMYNKTTVIESSHEELTQLGLTKAFLSRLINKVNDERKSRDMPPLCSPAQQPQAGGTNYSTPSMVVGTSPPQPLAQAARPTRPAQPAQFSFQEDGQRPAIPHSAAPITDSQGMEQHSTSLTPSKDILSNPQLAKVTHTQPIWQSLSRGTVPYWDASAAIQSSQQPSQQGVGSPQMKASHPHHLSLALSQMHEGKMLTQLMPSGATAVPRAATLPVDLNLMPAGMVIPIGATAGQTQSQTDTQAARLAAMTAGSGVPHLTYGVHPGLFGRATVTASGAEHQMLARSRVAAQTGDATILCGSPPHKVQKTIKNDKPGTGQKTEVAKAPGPGRWPSVPDKVMSGGGGGNFKAEVVYKGGTYKAEIVFPNGRRKSCQRAVKAAGSHEVARGEVEEWIHFKCRDLKIPKYRYRREGEEEELVHVDLTTDVKEEADEHLPHPVSDVGVAVKQIESHNDQNEEADDELSDDGSLNDDGTASSQPDKVIAVKPLSQAEGVELRQTYARVCVDIIEFLCFLASFEVQGASGRQTLTEGDRYKPIDGYCKLSTDELFPIYNKIREVWNPARYETDSILFRDKVIRFADCLWRLLNSIKSKPIPTGRAVSVDNRLAPLGKLKEDEFMDILRSFEPHLRFLPAENDQSRKMAANNTDGNRETIGISNCLKNTIGRKRTADQISAGSQSICDVTGAACDKLKHERQAG
eukprot:GHVN01066089.1.p2 GENE.GHVN01066089.1~~GHVN01066089.1.p2  ORF type:complete len:771 (-),score=126.96 GHVN01066089.1:5584-7896(-)